MYFIEFFLFIRIAKCLCGTSLFDSAHTDSIITEDKEVAELFLRQVDRYTRHCLLYFDIALYVFHSSSCTSSFFKHDQLRPQRISQVTKTIHIVATYLSC